MSRSVRRVSRTTFREGPRQQVGSIAHAIELFVVLRYGRQHGRGVDGRVNIECAGMRAVVLDARGKLLRTKSTVHKPLLKPHSLQRSCSYFAQQSRDVRSAKSSETDLRRIAIVRIAVVDGRA